MEPGDVNARLKTKSNLSSEKGIPAEVSAAIQAHFGYRRHVGHSSPLLAVPKEEWERILAMAAYRLGRLMGWHMGDEGIKGRMLFNHFASR
jgi:hypothetical protein